MHSVFYIIIAKLGGACGALAPPLFWAPYNNFLPRPEIIYVLTCFTPFKPQMAPMIIRVSLNEMMLEIIIRNIDTNEFFNFLKTPSSEYKLESLRQLCLGIVSFYVDAQMGLT